MYCFCYSKLHQEELHEKYTEMGVVSVITFPLLLQVTFTNPLESYHSELKKLTSPLHSLIGMFAFCFSFSILVKFYLHLSFFTFILLFDSFCLFFLFAYLL